MLKVLNVLFASSAVTAAAVLAPSLAPLAGASPNSASPNSDSYSIASIEPNSLVPGNSTDGELVLAALFTPLVGVSTSGQLQYLQAQSVAASNHDRTWTVTIRKGWTFQNGEPVTAASYVDAWNYNAYGPHAYATSGQLAEIVGYQALNPAKGKPSTTTMSGLTVLGPDTFRVELSQPDSQFPYELTANQWAFYPLPEAAYKNLSAYDQKPIGDGPYEMNGVWQHDEQIALRAYPGYKGPNKPKTPNLIFKIYSNADTAYTDVLAGNTDMAAVPPDKLSQFEQQFGGHYFERGGQSVEWLGFPLFVKQYQNVKLREAISLAIDRQAINKALFGGVYQDANSYLPPTTPGGDPASCQYCRFDPAEAKHLLKEAGGFKGKMVLTYLGGFGIDQEMDAIANEIRQNLGISIVAQPTPTLSAYFTNAAEHKYTSGPLWASWSANYPSAQNILTPLFTPSGAGAGALDETNFTSPKVSALISAANAAATPQAATKLYHEAEAQVMASFPAIPLFFDALPMVYSSRISHVSADEMTNPIYTAITVNR